MRNRSGFTLIEILIVIVVIGILAAIAIPKFASVKEKAYIASMKSDLRNLTTAQEAYFYDNSAYASDISVLTFNGSSGVTVTLGPGTTSGWSASAQHSVNPSTRCTMWYGTAAPIPPGTAADGDGAVVCR